MSGPSGGSVAATRRQGHRLRGPVVLFAVLAVLAAAAGTLALVSGGDQKPPSDPGHTLQAAAAHARQAGVAAQRAPAGAAQPSDRASASGALPAAPAGLANQLTGVYGQIHAALTTLGVPGAGTSGSLGPGTVGLPTVAAYEKLVHRLSARDLSMLYAGTLKSSGWSSLGTVLNGLDLDAVAHQGQGALALATATKEMAAAHGGATAGATAGAAPHNLSAAADPNSTTFPPASPTGPFPQPPAPYAPTSPVGLTNLQPVTCPQPPPGPDLGAAAVYSAQVSDDIINETVAGLPSQVGVVVAGTNELFPDPARIALMVVADADVVLLDTMNYLATVWTDCNAVQGIETVENLDNTTVNTYDLMTLMESTLDDVESSVNTISGQVHVVQQTMDDQLTLTIDQDLAAPAGSTPNVALELPASVGGNLDSQPIGVQEIVTAAVQRIGAAGEAENPAATQYLALANAALAGGNDTQAYAEYHTAYLEAVQ